MHSCIKYFSSQDLKAINLGSLTEISNLYIIIYFFNILAMNTANTWLETISPLNSFYFDGG